MKKQLLLTFLILFFIVILNAQELKTLEARYLNSGIKIDGLLNESAWKQASVATDFIQFEPDNGGKASQRTEVRVLYDNSGLYIGAIMYDSATDSIRMDLSKRDELGIFDAFSVSVDPFNNGLYAYSFIVSAAGVQTDMKTTKNGEDFSWDAVWDSEVSRFDSGWIAEIKIPFSALRFSTAKEQVWKINFYRFISRKMEISTWQYLDKTKPSLIEQYGLLTGLKDVKPPLRLAFIPYVSAYVNNEQGKWTYKTRGGMDLKYGLNESFTLDMMLIPDFGQVESDDQVLNLSPFETYYVEKRQFFTEGSELFDKAGIFYSRRIGSLPIDSYLPYYSLDNNEVVKSNPSQTQIVNATKITGRTNRDLGIGILNAITSPAYAVIEDTITGEQRKFMTQGWTNYNVFVLDQPLKNNSYFSFINTNVWVEGGRLFSDVAGTDFQFRFADGLVTVVGNTIMSQRYTNETEPQIGFRTNLGLEKSKGNFQYGISTDVMDDKYDINDLGFLRRNNRIESRVWMKYSQVKASKLFLNWSTSLSYTYRSLYTEGKFETSAFHLNMFLQFKNLWSLYIFNYTEIRDEFNWYEPRIWGRFYRDPRNTFIGTSLKTDPTKKISYSFRINGYYANTYKKGYSTRLEIIARISNNFNANYLIDYSSGSRFGFVDYINYDTIYFGHREQQTITNTINLRYNFTNKHSLNVRVRHYWSIADYSDQYYLLGYDGNLYATNFATNADINYNAFTIDLIYTWNFAPGSELTFMWKNQIFTFTNDIYYNILDNLTQTIASPQSNILSIKILYYLDWTYFNR